MSSLFLGVYLLNSCFFSAAEGADVVRLSSGRDATLQCHGPTAASITLLEWSRIEPMVEGYVFFYRNNRSYESFRHPTYRGRVELKEPSTVRDGDVSVVLKNVSVLDTGTYECRVTTSAEEGGQMKHIELSSLVHLTVTDSGGTEELRKEAGSKEAGDKEAGDKEAGDKEGGRVDVSVRVVVGVVVGVMVVLCLAVVVVCCKIQHKQKPLKKKSQLQSCLW